jgi:hypothetical protein
MTVVLCVCKERKHAHPEHDEESYAKLPFALYLAQRHRDIFMTFA